MLEPVSGTSALPFAVTLSAPSASAVTVSYVAASAYAAEEGTDFASTSGSLVIPAGATAATATVNILPDTLDEDTELLSLSISSPTTSVLTSYAYGAILDDDDDPGIDISSPSVVEGNGPGTVARAVITLSAPSPRDVVVAYNTDGGSATAGSDFTQTSGSVTFPAGTTSREVTIPVVGDKLDEGDSEYFYLYASPQGTGARNYVNNAVGYVEIQDDDVDPTLAVDSPSVREGTNGSVVATFRLTLNGPSDNAVKATYSTFNQTAVAGQDYTTKSGTVTFAPGQTVATVPVSVTPDAVAEPSETFGLSVSITSGALSGDNGGLTGYATILDDDVAPTISVTAPPVLEGTSASTTAQTFRISLSGPTSLPVAVSYGTADYTASAPADYAVTRGTVTIPAGSTFVDVAVPVKADSIDEQTERYSLRLESVTNAVVDSSYYGYCYYGCSGRGIIYDDDTDPVLTVGDVVTTEGNVNKTISFVVSLSSARTSATSFDYQTYGGSAQDGLDFVGVAGTSSIPAGQTSKSFTVTVKGDTLTEDDETFSFAVGTVTGAFVARSTGTAVIIDNDPLLTPLHRYLTISDTAVTEGNSGTTPAVFTVKLDAASTAAVSVNWATCLGRFGSYGYCADESTTNDYVPDAGTLVFAAGETSKTVTVNVLGDTIGEANEALTVVLADPVGAFLVNPYGQGSILDDDQLPVVTVGNATVDELDADSVDATVVVALSKASTEPVMVDVRTDSGSATAGADFETRSERLVFAPGETSKPFVVTVLPDTLEEDDEFLPVYVESIVGAEPEPTTGSVRIVDLDLGRLSVLRTGANAASGIVTSALAGIECGGDCVEDYPVGTTVTLTASAPTGTAFDGWSGPCTGTGTCVVTVDQAVTVSASFIPVTYDLTVTRSGAGDGTVTSTPAGISCGAVCTTKFGSGTSVTLNAASAVGSTFAGWSGACTGTGACSVAMTGAQAVTATFTLDPQTLTVARTGTGAGTVTSAPAGISCGNTCSQSFPGRTSVVLTAAPDSTSTFVGWSGPCTGTGSCTVLMSEARTVTAEFQRITYDLTVARAGSGAGFVTSNIDGISCGSDCSETLPANTAVTLTATPAVGSTFTSWSGACTGSTTCALTMSAARSVTATFTADRTLTVAKAGTGSGTVSSSPTGISCGTACSFKYKGGQVVTLTQAPNAGSTFTGWSGSCSGTTTCSVTMSAARSVTATWSLDSQTLTVSRTGAGSGTVTSSPTGISCGTTCSKAYAGGTSVSLTATPAAGSVFVRWSGDCAGSGACTVTMNGSRTVGAEFAPVTYVLDVARAGSGTGFVTSDPGGINCGNDCTEPYAAGTVVTLVAAEGKTSTFTGWSGGGCSGTGPCSVTVSAATTVTANFTLDVQTLNANRAGTGSGTITSSPAGISCGSTCSATYPSGTQVTLTATPSTGSTFLGWSGDCVNSSGTCVVTMSQARSVTASFQPGDQTLTVTRTGAGSGTVTSSPAGISCGSTCSATFPADTAVSLTATPAAGSMFTGWTGDCSGTGRLLGDHVHGTIRVGGLRRGDQDPHGHQAGQRVGHGDQLAGRHRLRHGLRRGLRHRHQRHADGDARLGVDVRRLVRRLLGDGDVRRHGQQRPVGHGHVHGLGTGDDAVRGDEPGDRVHQRMGAQRPGQGLRGLIANLVW